MRIQFEIKESLPEIYENLIHSDQWLAEVTEFPGKKTVSLKDVTYKFEASADVFDSHIFIKTAWSKYTYRIYNQGEEVWCEYVGAYRGLLEQKLLPKITPKESLLDCEVLDSSLLGNKKKTLREYAEDNMKLKAFRRQNFNEANNGYSPFDHPLLVYDEFIKEDYIPDMSDK